jgi:hypothetical protein
MKKLRRGTRGGQEGLFLKARKPFIADIFTDDGAVFLFDETVVVFLVVTAVGEGEELLFAPDFSGVVNKLGAVIAVELQDGEGEGSPDVREGLESPGMGVIEEGTEFCPTGGDIGGGQGMEILAQRALRAAMTSSV